MSGKHIFGLVLAGGKSSRMGSDKGLIDYHGQPQRYYLADLLAEYCQQVYISCRPDQVEAIEAAGYQTLSDQTANPGQFGAILGALASHSGVAWLVVACDLPLIDRQVISRLVEQRDSSQLTTAYADPASGLPEPLMAVWEPAAKAMLEQQQDAGIDCPRKALIINQAGVKLIDPPTPDSIMNANTPQAAAKARQVIAGYGQ